MGLTDPQSRLFAHRPGHHDRLLATSCCRDTQGSELGRSGVSESINFKLRRLLKVRVPALLSNHQPFTQQSFFDN